ncbi:nuclear transport factor 2 family protein [Pseudonocardia acaciae]|uniref:nuclear transport factor 2 family protein n=1 Tax=Pseudonocardia acaciae TaxID=551276 RepID=UPI0007E8DA30|nr:nuclear transport factor 2 family protein [Pseudonocardia acaciae]
MAAWPTVHQRVVQAFADGWERPHPNAWDGLLAEDIELVQPLLPSGHGRHVWQEEMRRLLAFLPDLRGEVLGWAGREDRVFLHVELSATVGTGRVAFRAVDQLELDQAGTVLRRESFFDPAPVAAELARRPASWLSWWRSGVGPMLGRRRLLERTAPRVSGGPLVRGLGGVRLAVGLSSLLRPQVVPASLGLTDDGGVHGGVQGGIVARMFAAREAVIGLATLSGRPAVRDVGLRLGLLTDIADAVLVVAGRGSGVSASGMVRIGGFATVAALLGVAALRARPTYGAGVPSALSGR